jgi:hypothetical protein
VKHGLSHKGGKQIIVFQNSAEEEHLDLKKGKMRQAGGKGTRSFITFLFLSYYRDNHIKEDGTGT